MSDRTYTFRWDWWTEDKQSYGLHGEVLLTHEELTELQKHIYKFIKRERKEGIDRHKEITDYITVKRTEIDEEDYIVVSYGNPIGTDHRYIIQPKTADKLQKDLNVSLEGLYIPPEENK